LFLEYDGQIGNRDVYLDLCLSEFHHDVIEVGPELIGDGFEPGPVECFVVVFAETIEEVLQGDFVVLVEEVQVVFFLEYFEQFDEVDVVNLAVDPALLAV
jgi:hypothetical protein